MSKNPNNCATCQHTLRNDGEGHCYMFADAPTDVCMQHTGRTTFGDVAKHFILLGISAPRQRTGAPGEWFIDMHVRGMEPTDVVDVDMPRDAT